MVVRNLHKKAEETGDEHLKGILEQLKTRKCRVLAGNTPRDILVEISHRNNAMNKVISRFTSPFVDTIEHARNQYVEMGQPPRPDVKAKGEKIKKSPFQEWESVALRTLERVTLNEVNWLLYATPELYMLWKAVATAWIDGTLPGPDGVVHEKTRHANSIMTTMFKCFEGDLKKSKLHEILQIKRLSMGNDF